MSEKSNPSGKFEKFREKLVGWQQSELSIRSFEQKLEQLQKGVTGLIPEVTIRPADGFPRLEEIAEECEAPGYQLLKKAVMIKLNGGLGTSMGMDRAKSLLKIRDGLSFLDVIARHSASRGAALILMNSHRTRHDSLEVLREYSHMQKQETALPLDFEQSMHPKVNAETLLPVEYPEDRDLEWCPPGHGDVFTAIVDQGILEKLLKEGYQYAFISNSDNLSASLHPGILGYMDGNRVPFLMEVTRRTPADRKGGHLARSADGGRLLLRESAQCPADDQDSFQDIDRHRFFNTNNIWVDLRSLEKMLDKMGGVMPLPLIRNKKNVNPVDPGSTRVFQLETAMGSAISLFPGAEALEVPRTRFMPVKSCEDLLMVRSDRTLLDRKEFTLAPNADCRYPEIRIKLDPRYYKFIDDWEKAFPEGVPSLRDCSELCISGPFLFRKDVTVVDQAELVNRNKVREELPAGTLLNGFYLA